MASVPKSNESRSEPGDHLEPFLPWVSELAIRKFEYADRAFDACNSRAGSVIGFAGILTAIAIPSIKTLPSVIKILLFAPWFISFSAMLFFAWQAYRVSTLQGLPFSLATMDHYGTLSNVDARKQALTTLVAAAEHNESIVSKKAALLNKAIICFAIEVLLLMMIVLATVLSPVTCP